MRVWAVSGILMKRPDLNGVVISAWVKSALPEGSLPFYPEIPKRETVENYPNARKENIVFPVKSFRTEHEALIFINEQLQQGQFFYNMQVVDIPDEEVYKDVQR